MQQKLPKDNPILVTWGEFKESPAYFDLRRQAANGVSTATDGALWYVYMFGWLAAKAHSTKEDKADV